MENKKERIWNLYKSNKFKKYSKNDLLPLIYGTNYEIILKKEKEIKSTDTIT